MTYVSEFELRKIPVKPRTSDNTTYKQRKQTIVNVEH